MISGFRREIDENCVFLRFCAVGGGYSVPTIRDNQLVPSSGGKKQRKKTLEDRTDMLSRNIGKELPVLA